MDMKQHIEYLKMLRIPYKEAVFRAFHHIFNEHKGEINIEDLIKATCVYERPMIESVQERRPFRRFDRDRRFDRGRRNRYRY